MKCSRIHRKTGVVTAEEEGAQKSVKQLRARTSRGLQVKARALILNVSGNHWKVSTRE